MIAAPIKIVQQVVAILLVLLVFVEKPPEFIVVQVGTAHPSTRRICVA